MTTVHLLGGGTLDNCCYVLKTPDCIKEKLRTQLSQINPQYRISDHAYDRFTTQAILEGEVVGKGFAEWELGAYLERKHIDPNYFPFRVEPLKQLKTSVLANPGKTNFVVLSMGEQDLITKASTRELCKIRRTNPLRLLWQILDTQARYLEIMHQLHELKEKGVKPILITQFRWDPHQDCFGVYRTIKIIGAAGIALQGACVAGAIFSIWSVLARRAHLVAAGIFALSAVAFYGSTFMLTFKATLGILGGQKLGVTTLGCLLERFYTPILDKAKSNGIPIFDLTNSLNPCGRKPDGSNKYPGSNDLYTMDPCDNPYISDYAPRVKGGELIVKGICHILKNHNFEGESMIYYREPKTFSIPKPPKSTFQAYPNPGGRAWTVNYPKQKIEKV